MLPQRDAWGERLPRHLGLWSAVAVLVGSTIGSGIFRVPASVAERLQEPGPVLLAWVLGGVIALFGALTIAELAGALPRSGGVFAYILEAFGPLPAFLFGWSELTVIRASALGAIATIFAEYLGYFIRLTPMQVRLVAAVAVVAVGLLELSGGQPRGGGDEPRHHREVRRPGGPGAARLWRRRRNTGSTSLRRWTAGLNLSLMGTALIAIMWTYDGWADLSFMGGEVKNPGRTLPMALILGTFSILVIYLLLNVAYIYLVPLPEMAKSPLIAATAAERIPVLGRYAGAIISLVVMVSCFGTLHGSMMTGPRIFFAMSDRGLFFQSIARVSPRYQSPSVAIWLATGSGRGLRSAQRFSAAGRQVHPGHLAFLRPGGRRGLRPAAHPSRASPAVPHLGLSGRAHPVSAGVGGDDGERALDRPAEHRRDLRDYSGGLAGLLRLEGLGKENS